MMLLTFLIIVALLVLWLVSLYNGLIKQKNQVEEAWSGIDVQLKRRYDLIPNLIETVKGYTTHESELMQKLTELRTLIGQTTSIAEKGQLNSALSSGIANLIAVGENYPNLKASENFIQLQKDLNGIEDQIQLARRYYNGSTRDYNTSLQSIPQVFIANYFRFEPFEFFQIENSKERELPRVDFTSKES
ncbi:LemA family protein [Legionella sp. km772]|nr:LemA family protein [Legionella sp. km772]